MLLTKNGITIEVIHPADIARYKHLGYAEVKEKQPESDASQTKTAPKPKKGGEE